MNERNLYRGLNHFEGSIDDEGNLYDERHRLVGRLEGNDVYDYCNIKQGTIDEDGKLWDINHNLVGEARGNNFTSPTYQSKGMVRGDSFGEGDGSEYGALMMLKKRNRHYSGDVVDSDYEFENDNDDEDDWEDDFTPSPHSTRRQNSMRNGRNAYQDDDLSDGFGCAYFIAIVIFAGALIWYLLATEAHPPSL